MSNTIEVHWNEQEFRAYLMIFAANSNFNESSEEKELILSKISKSTYKDIHREFDKDNDYNRLQKILHCVNKFGYSEDEINQLEEEIREIINVDGQKDEMERNMQLGLHKLLH